MLSYQVECVKADYPICITESFNFTNPKLINSKESLVSFLFADKC